MAALIPVLTALESSLTGNTWIAIQENTESKFFVTFTMDRLQFLCFAMFEPRQTDISIQYMQAFESAGRAQGGPFFCQPRALPNETLPAHSAAEIAGRVDFERVTFPSSTFSSLFLSPNNTLDC